MPGADALPSSLPLGRRSPRGRVRWYPVYAGEGREAALCERVRAVLPREVLTGAAAPQREFWFHRAGAWSLQVAPLWRGYFVAASADVAELDGAFSKLSFPVRLVGSEGHAWTPLDDVAWAALSALMDASGVVRNSVAVVEGGVLRVLSGPLSGRENLICKVDRHKRSCLVALPGATVSLPLDVVARG